MGNYHQQEKISATSFLEDGDAKEIFAKIDYALKNGKHIRGCLRIQNDFIKKFEVWDESMVREKSPSLFQLVLNNLLDLSSLPSWELDRLEFDVKGDLNKRLESVKKYEEYKFIKDYKTEGTVPRNQEEKTLLEFYNRNINELSKITDHFLNHLRARAVTKSRRSVLTTAQIFEWYWDRPYLTSMPNSIRYFDHKEIDKVSHRIGEVVISKGEVLRELYKTDKKKFYEELTVITSFDQVIQAIEHYLTMLKPLTQAREDLFKEMIELFRTKKFYGFYSLALSQIEGLFTEMLDKGNPKSTKSSLPDKVRALRPMHRKGEKDFDYYEYFIPTQRNKFMHSGLDEDIELKSYDLLFDLSQVLSLYVSMEVPIVELTKLLKVHDIADFLNEEGFNNYFKLVEDSKRHPDYQSLELRVQDFEKSCLSGYLDFEYLLHELEEEIPARLIELAEKVKNYTSSDSGPGMTLDYWTIDAIQNKKETFRSTILPAYEQLRELFDKISGYQYFLNRTEQHLPNMTETNNEILKKLKLKHSSDLNKIKKITEVMNLKVPK